MSKREKSLFEIMEFKMALNKKKFGKQKWERFTCGIYQFQQQSLGNVIVTKK